MGLEAVLVLPGQLLLLIWHRHRARWLISAMFVTALCCIPLAVLAEGRGSAQIFWIPLPDAFTIKQTLPGPVLGRARAPVLHLHQRHPAGVDRGAGGRSAGPDRVAAGLAPNPGDGLATDPGGELADPASAPGLRHLRARQVDVRGALSAALAARTGPAAGLADRRLHAPRLDSRPGRTAFLRAGRRGRQHSRRAGESAGPPVAVVGGLPAGHSNRPGARGLTGGGVDRAALDPARPQLRRLDRALALGDRARAGRLPPR